jgi:hypothetical protein
MRTLRQLVVHTQDAVGAEIRHTGRMVGKPESILERDLAGRNMRLLIDLPS